MVTWWRVSGNYDAGPSDEWRGDRVMAQLGRAPSRTERSVAWAEPSRSSMAFVCKGK